MLNESRLDFVRFEMDKLINECQPGNASYFFPHLYGVSYFCTLLALRRDLNPEIAATSGMLHDIYPVVAGSYEDHGPRGAKLAEKLLRSMNLYSEEEISIISSAVSKHSKKRKIHEPYDELLKDADVMAHCLYDVDDPIAEKEVLRYKNVLAELGCEE